GETVLIRTNPLVKDTDGDGFIDSSEEAFEIIPIGIDANVNKFVYKHPAVRDYRLKVFAKGGKDGQEQAVRWNSFELLKLKKGDHVELMDTKALQWKNTRGDGWGRTYGEVFSA